MWNYRHLGDSQGQSEKQIYHTGQNLVFNQYTDWKDRNAKHPEDCVQVNRAEAWPTETLKGKKAKSQKVSKEVWPVWPERQDEDQKKCSSQAREGTFKKRVDSQCHMSHGGQSLKHILRMLILWVYSTKLKEGSSTVAVCIKAGRHICAMWSLNSSMYDLYILLYLLQSLLL